MEWLHFIAASALAWLVYHISRCTYNCLFHPLRRCPGPVLHAATQLTNVYFIAKGRNCWHLHDLHEKYGDVVRIGPNELSFRSPSAIRTIYGGNPRPEDTFHKNMIANVQETGDVSNVFFAVGESAQRYRKIIAPALSERTIRLQEPMIQDYCSQLVSGLRNRTGLLHFPTAEGVVDIVPWTQFIISDVLSHMLFGASLGCLERGQFHPWVRAGYEALIESTYIEAAYRLGEPYRKLFEVFCIPSSLKQGYRIHLSCTQDKIAARAKMEKQYAHDLPSFISDALTEQETFDNINVIATAAGETTSSALSATLYYLTKHRDVHNKLVTEIRQTFKSEEDVTIASTASLRYLHATIRETFRIHPTIPVGLHRTAPAKGVSVDGLWVPGGTWISVANLAACRSTSHWQDPDSFIPERWLDDTAYEMDQPQMSVPYSIGVRNCIGMSHANAQLRLILSRMLWNFDMEACAGNAEPDQYLEYGTWQVEPLKLRVLDIRS